MEIPPFMLKKLYVKGSLQKERDGISFKLKNAIAPANLVGIDSLQVNGKSIDGKISLMVGDNEVEGEDITTAEPLSFGLKDKAKLIINNQVVEGEELEITVVLHTKEVGPLTLTFKDKIA